MKALTILQPWASLIACGAKKIETRSWATKYRGPIAIHAGKIEAKVKNKEIEAAIESALFYRTNSLYLPHGCVIATTNLIDCFEMTDEWIGNLSQDELAFGWFDIGRYAWILGGPVHQINPVPAKGMQGLWNWDESNGT